MSNGVWFLLDAVTLFFVIPVLEIFVIPDTRWHRNNPEIEEWMGRFDRELDALDE